MELIENQLKIKIPKINSIYQSSDSSSPPPPPPPYNMDLSDSKPPPLPIDLELSDSINTTPSFSLPDSDLLNNNLDYNDSDDESIPPPPPREDRISTESLKHSVPELNVNQMYNVKINYNEHNKISITSFLTDIILLSIICIPIIIIMSPFYVIYYILKKSE
jgi:hypothetical protein